MSKENQESSDLEKNGGFGLEVASLDADRVARLEVAAKNLNIELTNEEIEFFNERMESRTLDAALELLRSAYDYHADDINYPYDALMRLKKLSEGPEASPEMSAEDYDFEVRFEAAIIGDWSPYPEVRSATSMLDDPMEYCETIRMYVVGLVFTNVGAIVATFFGNRFPAISLGFLSLQFLIYPSGKFLELVLPDWRYKWMGVTYSLNPGPWSFKEQMLATQMMSACDGVPGSFNVITAQRAKPFFNFSWAGNFGYMILLTLTSNFLGYGIAGLLRGLLVYPVKCMWYAVLPYLAMNRALVKPGKSTEVVHGWKITRFNFFILFMFISLAWYWIPEFVFQALSEFNWTTWIAPQNVTLAAVTGIFGGLGLNPISTFDWTVIQGGLFQPMVSPFYATYVSYVGQIIGMFIICAIYFTKSFNTQFLPINGTGAYDNTGAAYNVSMILDASGNLDLDLYQQYSPAFLSAGSLVLYGSQFAIYTAAIVYTILYYRKAVTVAMKQIWISLRSPQKARMQYDDPFTRAIQVHPEVPEWWFLVTLVLSLVAYIGMVEGYKDTETPVWSVFFAVVINLVFILPFGLLYAMTDNYLTVSFLIQILIGYMIPGNANALMITQCIAGNFWEQAQNYITNQKQTHYAKISSRSLFRAQFLASFTTTFTSIAILSWEFTGIKNYCDPRQPQKFTCSTNNSFFAQSVMFGTLGPQIYLNGLYPALKYCFLIGAIIPIPFWLAERYFPRQLRRWNVLILLGGVNAWAPLNLYYTTGGLYVSAFFNWYVRNKYLAWWQKYNYVLFAALNTGVAFAGLFVFFSTSYNHIASVNWWGNFVFTGGPDGDGADWLGLPLEANLPAQGYFGPAKGSFPLP